MNRIQAIMELGLNLIKQSILSENEFIGCLKNPNWMFFEFELGYWEELKRSAVSK